MGDIIYLYHKQCCRMTKEEINQVVVNVVDTLEHGAEIKPKEFAEQIISLFNKCFPFPIRDFAESLGFTLRYEQFWDNKLSGYIACDDSLDESYRRIISVNSRDSNGHQRFTIAHELWHYFENYQEVQALAANGGFYSRYRTDLSDLPDEASANNFAANLLMPEKPFIALYHELNQVATEQDVDIMLSESFDVSATAIRKRCITLGLRGQ